MQVVGGIGHDVGIGNTMGRATMRGPAKFLAVLLIVGLLAPLPAAQADRSVPRVRWRPCHPEAGPNLECGAVWAPLDYDRPGGPKIRLALVRLPASDPSRRIGSLFLNPGGPGTSGVDMVLFGVAEGAIPYSREVRARFDLVGFDPRGIIRSTPLLCFRSLEEALSIAPPFRFPVTHKKEAVIERADRVLGRACERRGGPIVDHMATADVARDLDLLRAAVGDEQLTYAGYSYGSFLGITYANLFPDRVRAMVLDGVVDPIAWTTGRADEAATEPVFNRLRNDAGAQATLEEFFRLCDEAGPNGCAFAGDAAGRFAALADKLRASPTKIIDPETGEPTRFTYADFIDASLQAMYESASWPLFAQFLAELEGGAGPAALRGALAAAEERTGLTAGRERTVGYRNVVEGFPGVLCSDSDNPDDHLYWSAAGAAADEQFGYFGRIWTWTSSMCAVWDGFDADRYLGPFDHTTANPVLVVGTRFDPASRYEGALIVDDLLPNSSLLTVQGWGHTSAFLSLCADRVVSEYLLDGTTPPEGTTCAQDVAPFEAPSAARGESRFAERQRARTDIMSQIALLPWP